MDKFERIRYPDGQISAKFTGGAHPAMFGAEQRIGSFTVSERINNYEDLFYIRSIAEVLDSKGIGTRSYKLFIPCMFGQRSDRRFQSFQSFDLKLITDIINDCGFGRVEIFDPHSDVTLALINHSEKKSSFEFVEKAVKDIQAKNNPEDAELLLVSPDAGAYKKVFDFGEKLHLSVMAAVKCRKPNGEIEMLFTHDVEGKDCLIVDDLCDGGYTFIVLADKLKQMKARNVYLYVSHGLFSKGFKELRKDISHIYCTNSVKDLANIQSITVVSGGPGSPHVDPVIETINDFVTQFKVI